MINLITLDSIVADLQIEQEDYTTRNYKRLLRFAERGYNEIHKLFPDNNITKVKLVTDDAGIIYLPDDYRYFIAIGVPMGGKLWTMSKDNKLITLTDDVSGEVQMSDDMVESIFDENRTDYRIKEKGGENPYTFTIEENYNRIVINGTPRRTVYLYYIARNIQDSRETLVPDLYRECIVSYVNWKVIFNDNKAKLGDKQLAAMEHDRQMLIVNEMSGCTIEEMYDAYLRGISKTVRR